jgi:transcriptional regulator with XRE-family HTH domain
MDHPLRHYRKVKALSLEAFGQKVGVTAATISRIENRKQGVKLGLALRIAGATAGAVKPADFQISEAAQ